MSAPRDASFIDLLRSEAETMIVESAEGSTSSELAGALDARVLELQAYAAGQEWAVVAGRVRRRTLGQPPGRTGGQRRTALPHGRRGRIRREVGGGRGRGGGAGELRHAGADGGVGRRSPGGRLAPGAGERRHAGGAVPHRRQHHG